MADERDPQISQRYRQLGSEEPSPELDRAILAAARRPTSRHRWYASLAAAAVLIFAVAIVVQIERRAPDEVPVNAPSPSVRVAPTQDKVAPQERKAPQFAPEPPARAEQAPAAPPAPAPAPAPQPNANVAAPAAGVAPQLQRSMSAPRSAGEVQADRVETPDQWLERIGRMRELGQDEAADRELARFRERYPDYRISEATAKKVEKRNK